MAPQILGLALFVLGPVAGSFLISLSDWDAGGGAAHWVGLLNYATLFGGDQLFWQSLRNTFYFTAVSVPLAMVLALLVALALNQQRRSITIYRALCFAPTVTSSVAIAIIWGWLFQPTFGPINVGLAQLGITGPQWLSDTVWAMPAVIIVAVWHAVGYNFVLFLAGLKNIPAELQDAARVDGASDLQRLWHVTLPLLTPTTFFVMVVSIIGSFRAFDVIWILTGGGPINATNVLLIRMYELGFMFLRLGQAAALAWVLFALIFAVTLAQFRFSGWVHYG